MSPYNVMNKGFEQEPFSVLKLVAGGIAVALIAFIGVTMWLPPRPSPAAPARATARPWDAALVVAAPPPTPRQPPSAAPPALPVGAAPPPAVAEPPAERAPAPLTAMQPVESRSATALSSRFLDILRSEDPEDAPPRRQAQEPLRRRRRSRAAAGAGAAAAAGTGAAAVDGSGTQSAQPVGYGHPTEAAGARILCRR